MNQPTSNQRRVTSIRLHERERAAISGHAAAAGVTNIGTFMRVVALKHGHREAKRAR